MLICFADFVAKVRDAVNDPFVTNCLSYEVDRNSELVADLGFDSICLVESQMELEEGYGISLPCDEINVCKTLGDLFDLVASKV